MVCCTLERNNATRVQIIRGSSGIPRFHKPMRVCVDSYVLVLRFIRAIPREEDEAGLAMRRDLASIEDQ